jgi:flagellin-like protein
MRGIVPILGVLLALAFAGARAQERPPIHAEQGGVAIGGNVTNSTVGVPYEKLEEAVRSRTKDLKDLSEAEKDTIALLKE